MDKFYFTPVRMVLGKHTPCAPGECEAWGVFSYNEDEDGTWLFNTETYEDGETAVNLLMMLSGFQAPHAIWSATKQKYEVPNADQ